MQMSLAAQIANLEHSIPPDLQRAFAPATHCLYEWKDYPVQFPGADQLRIGTNWIEPFAPNTGLFRLRFENHLGLATIQPFARGRPLCPSTCVEVISPKFPEPARHLAFFRGLLSDLFVRAARLPFALRGTTGRGVIETLRPPTPLFTLHFLCQHRTALNSALSIIQSAPHRQLCDDPAFVSLAEVSEADADVLLSVLRAPDEWVPARGFALAERLRDHAPVRVWQRRPNESYDTPENRFVLAFLRDLLTAAQALPAQRWWRNVPPERQYIIREVFSLLRQSITLPMFDGVGLMHRLPLSSQVLLRRDGYRDLLVLWQIFCQARRPLFGSLEQAIEVRDIATLYETWAFFALVDEIAVLVNESPVVDLHLSDEGGLHWRAEARFGPDRKLVYNQQLAGYSIPLRPDFTWTMDNQPTVVLDAKFRLEHRFFDGRPDDDAPESIARRADLYKMHTYRDALVGVRTAVAIYPGDEFIFYARIRGPCADVTLADVLSEGRIGVGALAMKPFSEQERENSMDAERLNQLTQAFYQEMQTSEELRLHMEEHRRRSRRAIELLTRKRIPTLNEEEIRELFFDSDGFSFWKNKDWEFNNRLQTVGLEGLREALLELISRGERGLTPDDLKHVWEMRGLGTLLSTELLAYRFPTRYWTYSSNVTLPALTQLGDDVKAGMPHGRKSDAYLYTALEPRFVQIQEALEHAGLADVDNLVVDIFLWWIKSAKPPVPANSSGIPEVDAAVIDQAMRDFDAQKRDRGKWVDWESDRRHGYAISWQGQNYPVKEIVRMATGAADFISTQARDYLQSCGFSIVSLRSERENIWLFQANPRYYDLATDLANLGIGDTDSWSVTRYREEMKSGDIVLLWQGGRQAGLYAIGELISEPLQRDWQPTEQELRERPYLSSEWQVDFRFTHIPDQPLLRAALQRHPVLRNMQVLRAPQGTNFRVMAEEWDEIRRLLEGAQPPIPVDIGATLVQSFVANGLQFTDWQIAAFYTALQTKGFAILSGISGTGKTKLAQTFATLMPQPTDVALVGTADPIKDQETYGDKNFAYWWSYPIRHDVRNALHTPFRVYIYHEGQITHIHTVSQFQTQAGSEGLPSPWPEITLPQETGKTEPDDHPGWAFKTWCRVTQVNELDHPISLSAVRPMFGYQGQPSALRNALIPIQDPQSGSSNCLFIPVRPDWRDGKSLLGYYNPLTDTYAWTSFLRFLLRAVQSYRERDGLAWFVILDEMNLAHVEYYFADLLSVLESGRDREGWSREPLRLSYPDDAKGDLPPRELHLPPNLYIVGTVNVDETTHAFSPKVLDRAFTLELTEADFSAYPPLEDEEPFELNERERQSILDDFSFGSSFARIDKQRIIDYVGACPEVRNWLQSLNELLRPYELHFGYRVFDEIVSFLSAADQNGLYETLGGIDVAFDAAVLMKVLPKFHGSRSKLEAPLQTVLAWCIDPEAPAEEAIADALRNIETDGNVSEILDQLDYRLPETASRARRMMWALYATGFAAFG